MEHWSCFSSRRRDEEGRVSAFRVMAGTEAIEGGQLQVLYMPVIFSTLPIPTMSTTADKKKRKKQKFISDDSDTRDEPSTSCALNLLSALSLSPWNPPPATDLPSQENL